MIPRRPIASMTMLLAGLQVGLAVAPVRADVVAAKGRPALVSTQVLHFADGKLVCRGDDGAETTVAIEQVDYLQISGWQMFNLAEQQRRAGEWRRAAVSYEKALAELQLEAPGEPGGSPPGGPPLGDPPARGRAGSPGLDRVLLVKARLVQACDAQGRFERALELYLDIVERMPAVAETLRPKQLPETGVAWLEQADKRIDVVIARHDADALGRSLREWKQSWPRPTASAPSLPADGLPGSEMDPRMREQIGQVAGLVQSGKAAEALSRISVPLGHSRGGARAELYYWQGRALQVMASASPTSQPADQGAASGSKGTGLTESGSERSESRGSGNNATLARAGLAYMRVVVHFAGHQLAPECLYRAGQLCRLAGRQQQASQLWTELANVYPNARGPDGTVWANKAREELK